MKFHEIFIRYVSWQDSWRNSSHLYCVCVCVCHGATWRECESGALNAFAVVETRVDGNIGWLNTENCRNTHRNGKAMICNRNKHCEVAWAARIPKSIKIQWQRSEFMFSIWLRQWMNEANVCVCVCVLLFCVHRAFYVILNVPIK